MEPASLAISVVGLVALVGTCKELMKTTESFLRYNKEFNYYVELLRADRIYLEWVETNEKKHGDASRLDFRLARQNSLEDAANEDHYELRKNDKLRDSIHDEENEDSYPTSALKSLDEDRRAQISKLLSTLEENLKSLEDLLTASDPKSHPKEGWSREWMKRSRAQMTLLKKRTVYSIGGKKTTIEEQIQTSRNVISKVRLLQDVRQEQDLAAQISKLDENYGQEMKHLIQERIRAWVAPDSVTDTLEQHLSAKLNNTCQWLFSRPCWEDWSATPDHTQESRLQILWLNGPAGFGKSVLSAAVIEDLRGQQKQVAFYFYSSQMESKRYPLIAIRSMIWQIISDDVKLLKEVQDKFLDAASTASSSQIWNIFQFVIQSVNDVYLIFDGLDECSKMDPSVKSKSGSKSLRLGFLDTLMRRISGTSARVLLLSREEVDIRNGVFETHGCPAAEYSISREDVSDDLGTVALAMVETKLGNCKKDDFKHEISAAIQERSDGMFLWMMYLEDTFNSDMSARELRDVVQAQPRELDDLFEGFWTKLVSRQNYEGQRALQILQWLAFALRPLTVAEVVTALSISNLEEEDDAELFEMINESFIRKRIEGPCLSLVTVKQLEGCLGPSSEVNLFHDSVKGFLTRKFSSSESTLNGANARFTNLAQSCLEYLMKDIVWGSQGDESKIVRSLRDYATQNWPTYIHHCTSGMGTTDKVLKRFFSHENIYWTDWRDLFEKQDTNGEGPADREYYAAQFGLREVLEFLQNEEDLAVNRKGGKHGSPLQVACFYQHPDVVDLLLKSGADVDLPGGHYGSALAAAAVWGATSFVQKLLSKGARDMPNEKGKSAVFRAAKHGHLLTLRKLHNAGLNLADNVGAASPLVGASSKGHKAIVKYLIEQGVEVDKKGELGSSALGAAAPHGHLEIASMLVENGANVNDPSERSAETPLYKACEYGHTKLVEYLVGRGADTELCTAHGWSPLNAAAACGHLETVQFLVNKGANVATPNKLGWTALHGAANRGHTAIAELLLLKGADPNPCALTRDFDDQHHVDWVILPRLAQTDITPLHEAIQKGHNDIVMLLLENGANIEATLSESKITPLILATADRRTDIAKMLLRCGANVHAKTKEAITTLSIAVSDGLLEITELCLEYGASIDELKGENGDSLLTIAADRAQLEMVELLVQRNAEINKASKDGSTPLLRACECGAADIVRILVDHGAKVDVLSEELQVTPVHFAARHCGLNTVSFLRSHGGDLHARSKNGWTPLHYASQTGNLDTVKYLIDNGSDIYAKTISGRHPTHQAAQFGSHEVLQELIRRGGYVNVMSETMCTPLHYSAREKDSRNATLLLQLGAFVNSRDKTGWLPIHEAASRGHCDIATLLIRNRSRINAQDDYGWTPLHRAAVKGHLELVQVLLLHNAYVNALTKKLASAAFIAAREGHLEILKVLIRHGAWLNCTDIRQNSVLHVAAKKGYLNVIEFLILKGVAVETRNNIGCTALHFAAAHGNGKTVKTLLEKYDNGIDIKSSEREWTPLYYAVSQSNTETTKVLLEHKADVYHRDAENATPLIIAARGGNVEILEILLGNDADNSAVSNFGYNTVCIAAWYGKLEAIKFLIDLSAEIDVPPPAYYSVVEERLRSTNFPPKPPESFSKVANATDNNDDNVSPTKVSTTQGQPKLYLRTAINCAAQSGHRDVVQHLLDCGVGARDIDIFIGTALRAALHSESKELPWLLLDAGANIYDVDFYKRSALHVPLREEHLPFLERHLPLKDLLNQSDVCGCTPAHYFAAFSTPKVITMAVEAGADFQRPDNAGWTALHWAAYCGPPALTVESLINLGIDPRVKDWQGRMPYQLAMKTGKTEIARLLCPSELQERLEQPVERMKFIRRYCDSCYNDLSKDSQRCENCPEFDLCFRCFKDVEFLHPGHSFQQNA